MKVTVAGDGSRGEGVLLRNEVLVNKVFEVLLQSVELHPQHIKTGLRISRTFHVL